MDPNLEDYCRQNSKQWSIIYEETLDEQVATYEELCTLLADIEACLNFRTLCALSDDTFNPTNLSPGIYLMGEILTLLPVVADLNDVKCNKISRWQTYQPQLKQRGSDGHPSTSRAATTSKLADDI